MQYFARCTNQQFLHQSIVLLSAALVDIQDVYGNYHKIIILLDTTSMANFIYESWFSRLGLKINKFSFEGLEHMSSS